MVRPLLVYSSAHSPPDTSCTYPPHMIRKCWGSKIPPVPTGYHSFAGRGCERERNLDVKYWGCISLLNKIIPCSFPTMGQIGAGAAPWGREKGCEEISPTTQATVTFWKVTITRCGQIHHKPSSGLSLNAVIPGGRWQCKHLGFSNKSRFLSPSFVVWKRVTYRL